METIGAYVRVYQWLGFQPYRLESGKISPFLAATVAQFAGVVVNLTLIINRRYCILYQCEATGMVVDFIKLLTTLLAHLVIYVELFRNIGSVCRCWKALQRVHQTLQRHGMVNQRLLHRTERYYLLLMLGTFLCLVASDGYCYFQTSKMQAKRFYVYFFTLQYLLHLKEQQLMYPVVMLDCYLCMICDALEHHVELLQHSERLRSTRYVEFLAAKTNYLKLVHSELFLAGTSLDEAYRWTYLIIYCKNYIQLISNSYWVVFWMLNKHPMHAMRIYCRLLIRMVLLFVLFFVNCRTMRTSTRFRYRLNTIGLEIQLKNKKLFVMIESFIQQVNLERIRLTAGDCFILNYKPILVIAITGSAYISMFIQEALKGENIANCYHRDTVC